jgi:hypothetical protein
MALSGVRSSWLNICEELRLMLAGHFELSPFFLDFMEEPGILDCQHRLRGKGLDQILESHENDLPRSTEFGRVCTFLRT